MIIIVFTLLLSEVVIFMNYIHFTFKQFPTYGRENCRIVRTGVRVLRRSNVRVRRPFTP